MNYHPEPSSGKSFQGLRTPYNGSMIIDNFRPNFSELPFIRLVRWVRKKELGIMSKMTYDEIKIRNRRRNKIRNNATRGRRNHGKNWTVEDELIALDPEMKLDEKARILGRTIAAVSNRMSRLGLSINEKKPWTDDEIEIAKDMSLTDNELADLLDRSVGSVCVKRSVLRSKGELTEYRHHMFTNEEVEIISDLWLTNEECAELLDRSLNSIASKRCRLRKQGLIPASV